MKVNYSILLSEDELSGRNGNNHHYCYINIILVNIIIIITLGNRRTGSMELDFSKGL